VNAGIIYIINSFQNDIRIPFYVFGPNLAAGMLLPHPVLTIDLAPTFFEIANISNPPPTDGTSFFSLLTTPSSKWSRSFLVEYSGEGGGGGPCYEDSNVALCSPDVACNCFDARNNTFSCVRNLSPRSNTIYCTFKDEENFVERYDMNSDPYQMDNLG